MKTATLLSLLAVAFLAVTMVSANMRLFNEFQRQHNKFYSADEFLSRYQVFTNNLERIAELNANSDNNDDPEAAQFGITPFFDLSPQEFRATYLLPNQVLESLPEALEQDEQHKFHEEGHERRAIPTKFDWKTNSNKTVVTGIYNQGGCGSCWAFAAAENVESMWALSGRPLVGLSAQQILDCDTHENGCGGGWPTRAFTYVQTTGGLQTRASYPYIGTKSTCKFNKANVAAKIAGWVSVTTTKDETAMANWVATKGPVSVCLDSDIWHYYKGGVITTSSNCGTTMNHCVLVTGYNVTAAGMKIWNVRNQWGAGWGEQGYVRIQRGANVCGIAQAVTSATI